mmetsp:Transcript_1639/g.3178  ORF Transcript_1639/g.3178 Transcript_1639/m.3178 type:complete len:203 (-) Transcript_1639:122-730(-)
MALQGWGDRPLPFLAVGRVKDTVTLAYHIGTDSAEQQEQTQEVFQKLLKVSASKLAPGQRTRLQWNDGSVCCMMDQQGALLYCVVTSMLNYPERLAYALLYDLAVAVQTIEGVHEVAEHSLNKRLQERMRKLVLQYEDANNFPQLSAATSTVVAGRESAMVPLRQDARELQQRNSFKLHVLVATTALVILACLVIAFHANRK